MTNLEIFLAAYKKNLEIAYHADPAAYMWLWSDFDKVYPRMEDAVKRGTFNKDSKSFKMTCKELKISNTYKAIAAFIKA